MYTGRRGYI